MVRLLIWSVGDKENHIASIHLAQMLYVWPYIIFFSFPIIWPALLHLILTEAGLRDAKRKQAVVLFATLCLSLGSVAIMLGIIRYNTIVHPFTLADNRHYMFYIFRILLRHWTIKYLVIPIYFTCAWLVLAALGNSAGTLIEESQHGSSTKPPDSQSQQQITIKAMAQPSRQGNRVTFVLVWLLATTLSLVTAPLVEPRYFIFPWLFWRIHVVHQQPAAPSNRILSDKEKGFWTILATLLQQQLWIESAWFMVVNIVTVYIFLCKGFEWPQEPSNVQRFMW